MSDAIRPALEPSEWKARRSGPISLDVVNRIDYIVIEGPGGETVKVTGADEIFALISLANDALPLTIRGRFRMAGSRASKPCAI